MNRKYNLVQVTCIERLTENKKVFDKYLDEIADGNSKAVVKEMITWAKSDRNPISYEQLLNSANSLDERIVYDDDKYVLTSNEVFITLYEYIELGQDDYDDLRRLVSTMTYYEALDYLKGYNVSKEFESEFFDCNFKDITATILKENRYGGCIVSPNIEYWTAGCSEPVKVSFYKGINK